MAQGVALAEPRIPGPEEALTSIVALASSVDGVDAVIGAHEGFTYTVVARNSEYELYADEIAAATVDLLSSGQGRLPGDEHSPRIVVAEYGGKGIMVVDLGEAFTAAIIGEKRVLEALLPSVERIARRRPLACPKCGALLDVQSYQCPSCGRRIPFTAPLCPFCGSYSPVRSCPSCGVELSVSPEKVALASEAPPQVVGVTPVALAGKEAQEEAMLSSAVATLLGAAVTAAYYAVSLVMGIDPVKATIAGVPALASTWLLLVNRRKPG